MAEYIITDEQLDKLANKHERIIVLRSEYGDAFPVSMEGEILRGLVRCRDCRWYIFDGVNEYCAGLEYTAKGANAYVEPDGFCRWGERITANGGGSGGDSEAVR